MARHHLAKSVHVRGVTPMHTEPVTAIDLRCNEPTCCDAVKKREHLERLALISGDRWVNSVGFLWLEYQRKSNKRFTKMDKLSALFPLHIWSFEELMSQEPDFCNLIVRYNRN